MATLEDLKPHCQVKGILPHDTVTILSVQWHGPDVVETSHRSTNGQLGNELLFCDRQAALEVTVGRTAWAFNANPEFFRLVSEAYHQDQKQRAKVEQGFAALTRSNGAPRCRCRGFGKADWQAKLCAVDYNLKRLVRLLSVPARPAAGGLAVAS